MGDIDEARQQLIGAWRMLAFEDRDTEEDDWLQPYGPDAVGLAILGRHGS